MAIQVYLDSSDFSKISDPSGVADHLLEIKARLLSFAKSGDVVFRFSAAHIVEMAPMEQIAESAAEARVQFLAELCGDSCLLSFDQLMAAELHCYAANSAAAVNVYSNEGNWFPRPDDGLFSVLGEDRISSENFLPKFDGLSREAKRRTEREYFRNGKLRPEAKARILRESKGALDAVLTQMPMRPCDADVFVRYMIGDASKEQADNAFYASLRDPRWMIQWFRKNRDSMSPVIEWLRGPATSMYDAVADVPFVSMRFRDAHKSAFDGATPDKLSSKFRIEMQDRILGALSAKILERGSKQSVELNLKEIRAKAPGLSIAVSVLVDSIWASTSESPRKSLPSDFVDAVHSMYAPYVDVFRTDAFMAPLVARYSKPHGVAVVGKLTSLVEVIESRLRE